MQEEELGGKKDDGAGLGEMEPGVRREESCRCVFEVAIGSGVEVCCCCVRGIG